YTIKLWDPATRTELASFEENAVRIDVLAFSPDGKLLASAGSEERLDPTDHQWIAQNAIDSNIDDFDAVAMGRVVRFYRWFLGAAVGLIVALIAGLVLWRILAKNRQRRELPPDELEPRL